MQVVPQVVKRLLEQAPRPRPRLSWTDGSRPAISHGKDDEGFCFIVDRAKDMLIRGGENIYCVEVENALYEHPSVMDAAVVGIPHRTLGEEPAAVVTLKPDAVATEAELRAFVAARLAAFKVPVKVAFSAETLPRNANGKILKPEVKKVFES